MPTCQACGAEVPDDSGFCGKCGREVASVTEEGGEVTAVQSIDIPAPEEVPPGAGLEGASPVASGEPPGQSTPKRSVFGWLRTTKGVVAIGIVVVLVAGGVILGAARHSALVKSGVAYTEAQTDIQGGNLKNALSELQEVVSYDPNYQKAQNEITAVKQAQDIVTIASNVMRDSSKFDSDLSSFQQNYSTAVDKINAAWQDYTSYYDSYDAPVALDGVDATLASIGTYSSNISRDVSSISADFGEASSNSILKDFNTATLLDSYEDSSTKANVISNALSDASGSLKSGSFVYGSVPGDISTINTALPALQSDQLKSDQGTAQFLGYAMGVVDKLLGQPIKLQDINNSATSAYQ